MSKKCFVVHVWTKFWVVECSVNDKQQCKEFIMLNNMNNTMCPRTWEPQASVCATTSSYESTILPRMWRI